MDEMDDEKLLVILNGRIKKGGGPRLISECEPVSDRTCRIQRVKADKGMLSVNGLVLILT